MLEVKLLLVFNLPTLSTSCLTSLVEAVYDSLYALLFKVFGVEVLCKGDSISYKLPCCSIFLMFGDVYIRLTISSYVFREGKLDMEAACLIGLYFPCDIS